MRDISGLSQSTQIGAAGSFVVSESRSVVLPTAANSLLAAFFVDPADWALYNRLLYFGVELFQGTGDTAPAQSVYASLFPVTAITGTLAVQAMTLGAEVTGSRTPTRSLAAANTMYGPDESGPFTLSTAGLYVLALTAAGAYAAGGFASLWAKLFAVTR